MSPPQTGVVKRALVASVVVLVASVAVLADVGADPVLVPRTLASARVASVGVVTPGFPIDVVGATWATTEDEHGDDAQVRFRSDDRWGAWLPMGEDGAQAPGTFGTGLVAGGDAEAYQVRGVPAEAKVVALNTTDGPLVEVGRRPRGAAHAASPCRSRADWGADESLMTWAPTTSPVQVLTVHHTDTANGDPDPAATVRAIYRYHAVDRGWGDIGYQVLVDQQGVRYEGRRAGASKSCLGAGGDGSEFGHDADGRGVAGAHVANMNSGNFGVALLGRYSDVTPPDAQRQTLEEVLAGLAVRHQLDPERLDTPYVNPVSGATRTVATISGHRDWLATDCPGGRLYAALPSVRSAVSARMAASSTTTSTTSTTTTSNTTSTSPTTTTPISLTASVSRAKNGQSRVDLRWGGASTFTVDVWRNGTLAVKGTPNDGTHVDSLGKASGSFRYRLCDAGGIRCSTEVTATIP